MSWGHVRSDWPIVLILVVAGFLRFGYVWALPGRGPDRDRIYSDMAHYDHAAWQMVQGRPVGGRWA